MRSIRHWTPRYLVNRIIEKIYRRRHPDSPWLAPLANSLLEGYLKKTDVGLESGSGRSTIWFARRVSSLISVEHNRAWFARVSQMIEEENIGNVSYHLFEENVENDGDGDENSHYVQVAKNLPDNSINFALVDGIHRSAFANVVLSKIQPGGMLIVDNVERFLPSNSISPEARGPNRGPASPQWTKFKDSVRNWRCIWASNGIYDTAIFFKPQAQATSC